MTPAFERITDIELKNGIEALGLTDSPVCYRPHSCLLLSSNGYVSACCRSCKFPYGKYPEQSLEEIWFGEKRQELINALDNNYDFHLACDQVCYRQICEQNPHCVGTLLRYTDNGGYKPPYTYPSRIELIIDTACNYECIMCGGHLSSAIRKNREKVSPYNCPYDDKFIDQLEVFLKHADIIYLSGGEPFVSDNFIKVLERVAKVNPKMLVEITSNCSVYTTKIKELLKILPNTMVTVSLNSLDKENYKFITTHGNLADVLANLKNIGKQLNKVHVCPMIQNIHEIPDLVKFCDDNNLCINFLYCNAPAGGKLKGIHPGGTSEYVDGGAKLPEHVLNQKSVIPEFNIETLSKATLNRIHESLLNILFKCSSQNYGAVEGLCHRIMAMIVNKK